VSCSSDTNSATGGDSFHKDWEIESERIEDASAAIEMRRELPKFLNTKGHTEKTIQL